MREKLDHRFLDEVERLGPATLENLCLFIYDELKHQYSVCAVRVSRPSSGDACVYKAEPK